MQMKIRIIVTVCDVSAINRNNNNNNSNNNKWWCDDDLYIHTEMDEYIKGVYSQKLHCVCVIVYSRVFSGLRRE